jgi:hypothetical protein
MSPNFALILLAPVCDDPSGEKEKANGNCKHSNEINAESKDRLAKSLYVSQHPLR